MSHKLRFPMENQRVSENTFLEPATCDREEMERYIARKVHLLDAESLGVVYEAVKKAAVIAAVRESNERLNEWHVDRDKVG